MPQILFDANLISQDEINSHSGLIYRLLTGSLKYPNIKKLSDISYHNKPTYRAKLNEKDRLIYTYLDYNNEKTLCILAVNNHNYERLKRQLKSANPVHIESLELQENHPNVEEKESDPGHTATAPELKFVAAVQHKQGMIIWDEQQLICHRHRGPIIFSGPPGAGKTSVLYNNMLHHLYAKPPEPISNNPQLPILFISQSKNLIETLHDEYKKTELGYDVKFVTWLDYLKSLYPKKKPVTEEIFKKWLAELKWQGDAREIHYELSLIVALGVEKYLQLGSRQCHFAGDELKKKQLVGLLKSWQMHLDEFNAYDPMICVIKPEDKQAFSEVYCDETQNLPPAALLSLISLSDQCASSLDSQQCLLSSPYIHNCLKELLYKHFKNYNEIQLGKTWRCPPEIIAVGNHLMKTKYLFDNNGNRRDYNDVISTLPQGSGIASWVDAAHLSQLKTICESAGTVVIVDSITDELRLTIQKELGTNNILTAKEAIGLEFDNVILFNPISQLSCLKELAQRKHLANSGLNLEQWNALNALYVSLTRGKQSVYIFDETARKRWHSFTETLFGELPVNLFKSSNADQVLVQPEIQWLELTQKYLAEGLVENARQIMQFHLNYDEQKINKLIKAAMPEETSIATKSAASPEVADNLKNTENAKSRPVKSTAAAQQKNSKPTTRTKEQRMKDLLLHFNQANLLSLFKSPDGMEILFETSIVGYGCLFSCCVGDRTKHATLKKFIKDNGKLVAEKLTPHHLIKAKPLSHHSLFNFNEGEKHTVTSVLYHQNTESILHELFEKYSPIQRIIFIADSLAYNPINHPLVSDKKITALLSFSPKFISNNLREIVDLLCQPSRYAPSCSYAHQLLTFDAGITLVDKLISDPALLKHITTDLYKIPENNNDSMFYYLCLSQIGLIFLTKLYKLEPRLTKTITLENLLANDGKLPTAFNQLCGAKGIEGHQLLNLLIRPDIAKELPHYLPDNIAVLCVLSCSNDGIKIIRQMMDAQPDMVKLMTGKVLSERPETESISTFSLLSIFEEGVAVLNRVFDYHKEEFVKQLAKEAMYLSIAKNDYRSAFHYLQESHEGEQLLYRFANFGWSFPVHPHLLKRTNEFLPLASKTAFFATSNDIYMASKRFHAKPVDILLWFLSQGNKARVIKLVSSQPHLLLQKGNFTDSLGKHYQDLSPFEYCDLAEDRQHFRNIMLNCLKSGEGMKIKKILLSQKECVHEVERAPGFD